MCDRSILDDRHGHTLDALARHQALRLFVDRPEVARVRGAR
jgi:hypothetical protein